MASGAPIVDLDLLEKARSTLGPSFIRILGYFIEDGGKAVTDIEDGLRDKVAARIVLPAHTLKSEAYQFGANPLGDLAYELEMGARRCVERHEDPTTELLMPVARLRALFEETLGILERETNPLYERSKRPGTGPRGFSHAGPYSAERF